MSTIRMVDPARVAGKTREIFDAVLRREEKVFGATSVSNIWRCQGHVADYLARNPHYLQSTWRKEQVVMRDGMLAARDKRRVALGVAMSVRARYMIEYHAAILRQAGDVDADILEILGVVDHYTALNTLSDGMQIESDIVPPSHQ